MPHKTQTHQVRSSLVLLLTAFIWGIAFVAQRVGMEYIGPFLFAGLRFWLGALTLGIVLLFRTWFAPASAATTNPTASAAAAPATSASTATAASISTAPTASASNSPAPNAPTSSTTPFTATTSITPTSFSLMPIRKLIRAGVFCGFFLFAGGALQQVGLVYTSASKAGFLTALYIILVPVLGIITKHKTNWNTWIGVALAVAGLYFLSITENLTIQMGDVIVIIGAFFWAGHILTVDYFVGAINQREVLKLCIAQFVFAGTIAMLLAPLLDGFFVTQVFDLAALSAALIPILYAGVLSTGVAFTLQAIGQQGLPPAAAAIIMSLEAVFSVLGGVVLIHEVLSPRELVGCLLMFVAVILAQLPLNRKAES